MYTIITAKKKIVILDKTVNPIWHGVENPTIGISLQHMMMWQVSNILAMAFSP